MPLSRDGAEAVPSGAPAGYSDIAATLARAGEEGRTLRPVGGGTKLDWGPRGADEDVSTLGLDALLAHNEGDLTAVVQAGVPLAGAQEVFARAGQMLALDPPTGGGRATVGGVLACADSGPLRHRYGGPRDLVLGVRVALADGTVARAGADVIKNVAGYDLAKLLCGSLGTLGVICEATLRLHPRPEQAMTARGIADDASTLGAAARAVAGSRLELEALDVAWASGRGALLARSAGRAAEAGAAAAGQAMARAGLHVDLIEDDEGLWEAQRAHQRGGLVVKVGGLPARWGDVFADEGEVVGRAALGLAWVRLPDGDHDALARLRERLAGLTCTVLDGGDGPAGWEPAELQRRLKERFDPAKALPTVGVAASAPSRTPPSPAPAR